MGLSKDKVLESRYKKSWSREEEETRIGGVSLTIEYNKDERRFYLQSERSTYSFQIHPKGYLGNLYWGEGMTGARERPIEPRPQEVEKEKGLSLGLYPQEYPSYGQGDFRQPAYQIEREDGSRITDLRYHSHRVYQGKPELEGLPATYAKAHEAMTLEILLRDSILELEVRLLYTIFFHLNAITRSTRFLNKGSEELKIQSAMSLSVDLKRCHLSMLHLSGAWGREREPVKRPLYPGIQAVGSTGGMSGHQHNPFLALLAKETTEESGEVYGFHLIYSGNFLAQAQVDHYDTTRILLGINPFDFQWILESGESFQTPEGVLLYSNEGLNGLSRGFHDLYRGHLLPERFKKEEPPILFNTWEALYFDVDIETLLKQAAKARELGIDLFVLDDGWFGRRDDDTTSLGDWYPHREKLPKGLSYLGDEIRELGLMFGIWVEPEMVSKESRLYQERPNWVIQVNQRPPSLGRNQLVLDLTQKEVQSYLIETMTELLESAPISYVKWDMNRPLTEIGSPLLPFKRQKEVAHRYLLGLYHVLEVLTSRFPRVLFENCASGGGRFDPGLLYYMPLAWTSDNTDAVERLKIQYATSMVYPLSTIGAHVSGIPNHQMERRTPLSMRGSVATMGSLGYELDLLDLKEEELERIKGQIEYYKQVRDLIKDGTLYRLKSPFLGNDGAWMVVSKDTRRVLLGWYRILAQANHLSPSICLQGLNKDYDYQLDGGEVYTGSSLMHQGFLIPVEQGDFQGHLFYFEAIS